MMNINGNGKRPVMAIVQARMSSTRLPAKVMKRIVTKPVLWHVVARLKASTLIDATIVATSTDPSDDIIEKWCAQEGVLCYRGSLNDVLDRYYNAANNFGAKTVVRVTSDCPLIDPAIVDRAIAQFMEGSFDHVCVDPTHPDGLDCEVFSMAALKRAFNEAKLPSEREHVTPYIWKNPEKFRLGSIKCDKDLSGMRWTVDDERDLAFVTRVFEALYRTKPLFHMEDVLDYLSANPEVSQINSGTMRNEGYAKSLKNDAVQ